MGPNMTRRFSEPAVVASLAAGLTPDQVTECHRELYVFTVGCALTQSVIVDELGTAAIEALEAADSPVIVEHREALMAADHSDHTLFVHGLRTLIASWDPSIG